MNIENYKAVLAKIEADPETWDQRMWHCFTAHCFGGHSQILSGCKVDSVNTRRDARIWLDLAAHEADYLFRSYRTLKDFKRVLTDGFYDINGFNSDGFNSEGFNVDGFDRNRFDRNGFDCDGLDKNNQPKKEAK